MNNDKINNHHKVEELSCTGGVCKAPLDQNFWQNHYENDHIPWDIGYASPTIVEYMKSIDNKDLALLIPGAGNAYEAEELLKLGFTNITILDLAKQPIDTLKEKYKNNPSIKLGQEDFFKHKGKYDIIIEQTFFCAIEPILRENYVHKMHELLNQNGEIIGLLFDKEFEKQGPPFGGIKEDYIKLFQEKFQIIKIEKSTHSIPERKDNELFIKIQKK